jgi:hypothetical protein
MTDTVEYIDNSDEQGNFVQPKPIPGLKMCASACLSNEVECPFRECKHWINHQGDLNCDLISIDRNGEMTLRQIADRLGVSFVRIKQIEDKAMKKLSKKLGILRTIGSNYMES